MSDKSSSIRTKVLELLQTSDQPMTIRSIAQVLGIEYKQASNAVGQLYNKESIIRAERGAYTAESESQKEGMQIMLDTESAEQPFTREDSPKEEVPIVSREEFLRGHGFDDRTQRKLKILNEYYDILWEESK